MALFAGQPAGVQIKKWLIILVSLIVVINVLAACSLIVLQRSVNQIQTRYQPLLLSASEISAQVYRAQSSLYQYLGEYLASTEEVEALTDRLEEALEEALSLDRAGEWTSELEGIRNDLARYRVIVRNLPAIGQETDWGEVDEFRSQAVILGQAMEARASDLESDVSARIRAKASWSLKLSRIAVIIFLCFLGLSSFITVLLVTWWRQFQDMILSL